MPDDHDAAHGRHADALRRFLADRPIGPWSMVDLMRWEQPIGWRVIRALSALAGGRIMAEHIAAMAGSALLDDRPFHRLTHRRDDRDMASRLERILADLRPGEPWSSATLMASDDGRVVARHLRLRTRRTIGAPIAVGDVRRLLGSAADAVLGRNPWRPPYRAWTAVAARDVLSAAIASLPVGPWSSKDLVRLGGDAKRLVGRIVRTEGGWSRTVVERLLGDRAGLLSDRPFVSGRTGKPSMEDVVGRLAAWIADREPGPWSLPDLRDGDPSVFWLLRNHAGGHPASRMRMLLAGHARLLVDRPFVSGHRARAARATGRRNRSVA